MRYFLLLNILLILFSCSSAENEDNTENPIEIIITTNDFIATINENPISNQILGIVNASTNQGNLIFSIYSQTQNGAVEIDSVTGELKVANESIFDYESTPIISGIIKVSNNSIFELLNFTINLNDIEEPIFNIVLKDIIGGTFIMGGNTSLNNSPVVNVTVSSFSMSEKEITNEQYLYFLNKAYSEGLIYVEAVEFSWLCGVSSNFVIYGSENSLYPNKPYLLLINHTGGCDGTSFPESWNINNKSWIAYNSSNNVFSLIDSSKSDWPVNWINWPGASAFAQYFNMNLPTEAQWEYAARSGQQLEYSTDNGTLSSSNANYNGGIPSFYQPNAKLSATGSYNPNSFGLYDMGGNVKEYCQDYYSESFYENGTTNPVNTTPNSDLSRVCRGGSFRTHAETLLTYYRQTNLSLNVYNETGFRVVKN
jgi:formylglycine-generating enzyme required for sulfatase activity